MKYTMIERKPFPIYKVEHEDRFATVKKVDNKRWELFLADESLFFKSRRAAFYFFETGEKFKTNPVYSTLGGRKSTQRIR